MIWLKRAIAEYVLYGRALSLQRGRHQNCPVALSRIMLRTHHRDTIVHRTSHHTLNTLTKPGGPTHDFVADPALRVVAGRIRRTPSQLRPKETVGDVAPLQRLLQRFPVELRTAPAVWSRTDISDRGNPVLAQQRDETV